MKTLLTLIVILLFANFSFAQKVYNTTAGEMIFGFSNAAYTTPDAGDKLHDGNKEGSITDAMRFTVWFHVGTYWHYDFNNNIGVYSGISNRNIGFITKEAATKETTDLVKWKRRAYSVGVPLAVKFGDLENGFYFFVGAQYEWLYHYKEKEFLPSGKRKYTEWFSKRVNSFMPSAFGGVAFPGGLSIKVTYTLTNMMNEDYVRADASGADYKPYKYLDSKLIYVSLFQMIRWESITYKSESKKSKKIALL